jgi:hypothetical protein
MESHFLKLARMGGKQQGYEKKATSNELWATGKNARGTTLGFNGLCIAMKALHERGEHALHLVHLTASRLKSLSFNNFRSRAGQMIFGLAS